MQREGVRRVCEGSVWGVVCEGCVLGECDRGVREASV